MLQDRKNYSGPRLWGTTRGSPLVLRTRAETWVFPHNPRPLVFFLSQTIYFSVVQKLHLPLGSCGICVALVYSASPRNTLGISHTPQPPWGISITFHLFPSYEQSNACPTMPLCEHSGEGNSRALSIGQVAHV